ncbi:DUF1631 family protein [Solimonas sp. K1W22B-7]|uniref:DUF1631 family protein n=1 Tax=Solimonas sp. K1W22B-7 TaxID=2303331 RepID=UPI000E333294|nr:DUF1631 family protein [Solimonas sp. K1W22B-7]AXQ30152.1 DUF1631 family protein [Solimonas sp. K1W22B-7]
MSERKSPSAVPAAATAADAQAVLGELRDSLLAEMDRRLQSMMQSADAALFELARGSPPAQLPGFLNARHLLRNEEARTTLAREFREAIVQRLQVSGSTGSAASELALRRNDEVEDNIQLADMATRAGASCEAQLHELAGRFETLRRLAPGFPAVAGLSPQGLCEAFAAAISALPEGAAARLALNRLFESSALAKLRPVYAEAVAACERRGVRASPVTPQHQGRQGVGNATASLLQKVQDGQVPGPQDEPGAEPSNFLPDFAAGFSDSDLARLLLQAVQGVAAGAEAVKQQMLRQRAGLVGRMLDDILADPQIPQRLHPLIEAFRFPAIKAALADASFFTDRQHPVRGLINDMADMAGDTRIGGMDALQRFDGWARRVLRQANLAAHEVHERLAGARPLAENDVQAFLAEQGRQQQERHKSLLRRVREVVDQELELCTATCDLPEPVWPLLRSGWGPMMASHLLRQGPESQLYRSGMELLHRVLYALNPESPNARTPAERAALRVDLFKALTAVGMPKERAHELLRGLDKALNSFSTQDPPGTGAATAAPAVSVVSAAAVHPDVPEWERMSATMEITLTQGLRRQREPEPPLARTSRISVTEAELPDEPELELENLAHTTEIAREMQEHAAASTASAPAVASTPAETAEAREPSLAEADETPAEANAAETAEPVTQEEPAEAAALATAIADAIIESVAESTEVSPEEAAEAAEIAAVFAEPVAAETAAESGEAESPSATIVCLPLEMPTPQRFLEQLLRIGAWFRVYDRRSEGTRWLKLNSWFPQAKRASFTEFDGHNALTVSAVDLLEDLMEGRSEPIDIAPQAVMVLQALRQQYVENKANAENGGEASGEAAPSSLVA